jgi:hypothetical protein
MDGSGSGSGPDGGDILEMGPERPPRGWVIGRRTRLALTVVTVVALLAAGGTAAALRLTAHRPAETALTRLITEVTTVPASAAGSRSGSLGLYVGALQGTSVGVNAATGSVVFIDGFPSPTGPNGRPLTSHGKPEVLYVATEYCPYCAAQSWPLIIALSRFGEFSGLSTIRSPAFEGIAPVDGWTFYGSSYRSRYLAFVPVETYSNVLVNRKADPGNPLSYRTLQRLTPAEQSVFREFDRGRQTPFTDFAGAATALGTDVMPTTLAGLTWNQIAADLRRPKSTAGAAILFSANVLTYQLCQLTGDRPAAACPKS